jgi:RNA polymerase sigma factor (sigma-70 family)
VYQGRKDSVEGRPLEEAEQAESHDAHDEPRLVERARQGDAGAYGLLVRQYQDVVVRVAYLVTGDAAEAEDVAQDAFIKAYYALPRFHPASPFRPWLFQIVANEARNRRRSAGRRAHLAMRAADESSVPESEPSPEAVALADEQRRGLLDAVNQLRDEDRQAIAYRYFLDLSEGEMADALGCARGTVKSRLSRALGRLREQLGVAIAGASAGGGPWLTR